MNIVAKILHKILANQTQKYIKKKDDTPQSSLIHPRVTKMVQQILMNVIHHINKRKGQNHMIISTDAAKASDKIQHRFMIKTLTKVSTEGTYLNIIKAIYDKPTVNIVLNGKKLKDFLLKSGTNKNAYFHHFYQHSI